MTPNQTLETNCRPASPLDSWWQFGRAVYAPACVSGGGRSPLAFDDMTTLPTPRPRPQFLAQARREFAFVTTLGFVTREEHEGTYACFKDGFHIVYHSPKLQFRVEYYDMEFIPSFRHEDTCVSYCFIDTYLFANASGFAGPMFPIEKLEPVITRISADIDQHYHAILTGEPVVWRKLSALARAPREKPRLP